MRDRDAEQDYFFAQRVVVVERLNDSRPAPGASLRRRRQGCTRIPLQGEISFLRTIATVRRYPIATSGTTTTRRCKKMKSV